MYCSDSPANKTVIGTDYNLQFKNVNTRQWCSALAADNVEKAGLSTVSMTSKYTGVRDISQEKKQLPWGRITLD